MRKRLSDFLTLPRIAAASVLLFIVFLVILTKFSSPLQFTLLAGPENSTFYLDALRFKEILARDGVQLDVVETLGSVDNVERLLAADGPTAAFVDAVGAIKLEEDENAPDSSDDPELADSPLDRISSLGAIYLQPMWVFRLVGSDIAGIEELDGARLGVGPEGSTSRLLADLFRDNVFGDLHIELVEIGGADDVVETEEAIDALRSGRVEAVIAVGQPYNPLVDRLLREPGVEAAPIRRAEAYALHFHYLVPIRLPEGGYDLGGNVPPTDINTLAASTELLVSDLFPPPLADLLLQATSEVHGEASLFTERDAFPNPGLVSIQLNSSAARFYEKGPPFLRRYLPFQLATWIDRFIMVVVAFGSIAFAIFSILPRLVTLHLDRQLQAAYRRMEEIEKRFESGGDQEELLAELEDIDKSTSEIRILLRSTISSWLEMRQFLHDLRDRVAGETS